MRRSAPAAQARSLRGRHRLPAHQHLALRQRGGKGGAGPAHEAAAHERRQNNRNVPLRLRERSFEGHKQERPQVQGEQVEADEGRRAVAADRLGDRA